jgi:hypothetical protein
LAFESFLSSAAFASGTIDTNSARSSTPSFVQEKKEQIQKFEGGLVKM